MKLRIISLAVVATAMGVGIAGCPYVQGQPVCLVGHGYYTVQYKQKPGDPATGLCSKKKGEFVGVEKFNAPPCIDGKRSDGTVCDPKVPDEQTIALKSETLSDLSEFAEPGKPDLAIISQGKLAGGEPDANHFCAASTFNPVMDTVNGIGYQWSNVKFYVTPQIPGTQFTAELAYTEDGCTANYNVVGVYPVVGCKTFDENGDPITDPATGQYVVDPSLCAQADQEISGLALNPDFPVTCNADLGLCVLASDSVPALKTPAK
jgi:hypothetical protein